MCIIYIYMYTYVAVVVTCFLIVWFSEVGNMPMRSGGGQVSTPGTPFFDGC